MHTIVLALLSSNVHSMPVIELWLPGGGNHTLWCYGNVHALISVQ